MSCFTMRSNHKDVVSIFLGALLVSSFVLASLPELPVKTGELGYNQNLSSPEDCARQCETDEPPKICYYYFALEHYTVLGLACELCTPNDTNQVKENCQCVPADGVEKTILTVNRMIPGPSIEVCQGDKVVIDVFNNMEGTGTSIHWHGVLQKGSQYYDGVPMVTQCPIPQGTTFRYQWLAENAGTHFWHSHSGLQKLDGIAGSLIIREPSCTDPNGYLYDEDLSGHVIMLNDWMHEEATERFPGRLKIRPGQTPDSILISGKGQYTNRETGIRTNTSLAVFTVVYGRKYRFRLINSFCTVCPAQMNIQDHNMTLIATDGEPVQPVIVNTIISFAGERYDFVINANQKSGEYWIQVRGLGECGENRIQQLAILRYAGSSLRERSVEPIYDKGLPNGVILNPLDAICEAPRKDAICVNQLKHVRPIDEGLLKVPPDIKIFLPFYFQTYNLEEVFKPKTYTPHLIAPTGLPVRPLIDGIAFESPTSPLLSQIHDIPPEKFCNGTKKPANCGDACSCIHVINIRLNDMAEVIIVDGRGRAQLSHPFHLHGHAFHVVGMGRSPDKNVTKMSLRHARDLDKRGLLERKWDMMPSKDTVAVPNNGYVIFRFRANNPGYWLFHCHFLYHIFVGMVLVFHVGDAKDLPQVPPRFPVCGDYLRSIEDSFNCTETTSRNAWKPHDVSETSCQRTPEDLGKS